jgi:hypothetical protein
MLSRLPDWHQLSDKAQLALTRAALVKAAETLVLQAETLFVPPLFVAFEFLSQGTRRLIRGRRHHAAE